MKKTYINPSIVEVALQQQGLLCQSLQRVSSSNATMNYAGSDEDYISGGGDIRTKESSSLWDEEW